MRKRLLRGFEQVLDIGRTALLMPLRDKFMPARRFGSSERDDGAVQEAGARWWPVEHPKMSSLGRLERRRLPLLDRPISCKTCIVIESKRSCN